MNDKTILSQILCLSLLFFCHYGYTQDITLSLNKNTVTVGNRLTVTVAANRDKITAIAADVYLAVQFPDGSLYYFQDSDTTGKKNQIMPLVTGWTIQTLPQRTLISLDVPKLPSGTYKWYLTLCQVGKDVAQPAHWIANTSAEVTLMGGKSDDRILAYDEIDAVALSAASESSASKDGAASPLSAPPPAPTSAIRDSYEESDDSIIDPTPIPSLPPEKEVIPIQSGILTAGDIDDNLNFAAFQSYLDRQYQIDHNQILPTVLISDRVTLQVVDAQGQGINHARIRINPAEQATPTVDTLTGIDGYFQLFPQFDQLNYAQLNVQITPPADEFASPNTGINTTLDLEQLGPDRTFTFTLPNSVSQLPQALDIMLVIDTTGSMADELRYLTTELRDIISAVHERHPQVFIRFGLVVYRDEGDEYVVQSFDFTDSLNLMQVQLSEQRATGGGDYPEAMEQALTAAVNAQWRDGNTTRLLFLVADAPPHDENLIKMLEPVRIARQQGLRIYSLAASGVGDTAEFMLRLSALLTQARYLFLTDDSGVGYSHAEPSVPCYLVTRLDQLMSRVIASELAGRRFEPDETEIIRKVGTYQGGICQAAVNQAN